MPAFRVTARYGSPGKRYWMEDVEAASAVDALRIVADRIPADIARSIDIVELRVQMDPDAREFTPEA